MYGFFCIFKDFFLKKFLSNRLQVVFSKRSDYFQALLADHFQEASSSNNSSSAQHHQTTLTLNGVRPEVFAEVVRHVYSDTQEVGLVQPQLWLKEPHVKWRKTFTTFFLSFGDYKCVKQPYFDKQSVCR